MFSASPWWPRMPPASCSMPSVSPAPSSGAERGMTRRDSTAAWRSWGVRGGPQRSVERSAYAPLPLDVFRWALELEMKPRKSEAQCWQPQAQGNREPVTYWIATGIRFAIAKWKKAKRVAFKTLLFWYALIPNSAPSHSLTRCATEDSHCRRFESDLCRFHEQQSLLFHTFALRREREIKLCFLSTLCFPVLLRPPSPSLSLDSFICLSIHPCVYLFCPLLSLFLSFLFTELTYCLNDHPLLTYAEHALSFQGGSSG